MLTNTTPVLIKRRNGRSFIDHTDWETGNLVTSTDEVNAMNFADADAAKAFAKANGLDANQWRLVRRSF